MKDFLGTTFADESGKISLTIDENTFFMHVETNLIQNAKYWHDQNEDLENLFLVERDEDGDWYAIAF